jgi:hypothetical protein
MSEQHYNWCHCECFCHNSNTIQFGRFLHTIGKGLFYYLAKKITALEKKSLFSHFKELLENQWKSEPEIEKSLEEEG